MSYDTNLNLPGCVECAISAYLKSDWSLQHSGATGQKFVEDTRPTTRVGVDSIRSCDVGLDTGLI